MQPTIIDFQKLLLKHADLSYELEKQRKRYLSIQQQGYILMAGITLSILLCITFIPVNQPYIIFIPGIFLFALLGYLSRMRTLGAKEQLQNYFKKNLRHKLMESLETSLKITSKFPYQNFTEPPSGIFINQQELQQEKNKDRARLHYFPDDLIEGKGKQIRFRIFEGEIDIDIDYVIPLSQRENHFFKGMLISLYTIPKGANFDHHLQQGELKKPLAALLEQLDSSVSIARDLNNDWHLLLPVSKQFLDFNPRKKLVDQSELKRIYLEYYYCIQFVEAIDEFVVNQKK